MPTFKFSWDECTRCTVAISAPTLAEARKLFYTGDYAAAAVTEESIDTPSDGNVWIVDEDGNEVTA